MAVFGYKNLKYDPHKCKVPIQSSERIGPTLGGRNKGGGVGLERWEGEWWHKVPGELVVELLKNFSSTITIIPR